MEAGIAQSSDLVGRFAMPPMLGSTPEYHVIVNAWMGTFGPRSHEAFWQVRRFGRFSSSSRRFCCWLSRVFFLRPGLTAGEEGQNRSSGSVVFSDSFVPFLIFFNSISLCWVSPPFPGQSAIHGTHLSHHVTKSPHHGWLRPVDIFLLGRC